MDDYSANFAVTALWLTSLALPVLIFLAIDRFKSKAVTASAAIIAVGGGWVFARAYAIAAQSLTANEAQQINGAALAFSAVLGWVVPAIAVLLAWAVSRVIRRLAARQARSRPTP